jgi:uncharacterized LabA/DUF88 family protein
VKRIGIFIDGSNLYMSAKALGFKVDFTKLKQYYQSMGDVAQAVYFTALPPKDVESPLRRMVDYVEFNGFTLIQKETKEYTDPIGNKKLKGNMDVEIAVYMGEVASSLTDVVLYSGDGDFRCLLESCQRRYGVHCTVVSTRSLVADSLRRQANEYVDLSTLRDKLVHADHKSDQQDKPESTTEVIKRKRFGFLDGR